jgi:hypothetical protein
MTQPATKERLVDRARPLMSMSTTATIGMGLTATPTAKGSICPIACPISFLVDKAWESVSRRRCLAGNGFLSDGETARSLRSGCSSTLGPLRLCSSNEPGSKVGS